MLICAFADVMMTVGGIVIAILVLLLMITIHEFGHYIAGRKLGFKINEFAIGFGPKLISKKNKKGTDISLRAFPLGGFCAFEGEDEDKPDNPEAFNNQKPWKRMVVLAMGAVFNILSAVIFSFIMLLAIGNIFHTTAVGVAEIYDWDTSNKTVAIQADTPNPNFNVLQKDDVIIEVNGVQLEKVKDFSSAKLAEIIDAAPDAFTIVVKRGGETKALPVIKWTYVSKDKDENGEIIKENDPKTGLGFSMYGVYKNDYNILTALRDCVPVTFELAGMVLSALGQLFTTATGIRQMGGTVTTITVIAQTTTANLSVIFLWLPMIAVNLGVFNLLPVPALDGSRILICGIEWIRRKPLNRKVEGWIHAVGFIVLIGFVIVMDILQLFVFKQF